jgi:superfamily II DNA/RNA helicase
MLDMGFTPQIENILKFIPKIHQTLLFSATLPSNILKISEKYLIMPERISVGSLSKPIEQIKQETFSLKQETKYNELINQLIERQGSILVFVKTKHGADKIVKKLKYDAHSAEAIHGNLRQSKREKVIKRFRSGKIRVLIATDVAARGLDIPLIQHVINYDLPQVPEDYIHRVGRTGRAGKNGSALTFLTNNDQRMWREIQKLINPNFELEEKFNKKSSKKKKKFNKKRKSFKDKSNKFELRNKKRKFKFKSKKLDQVNSNYSQINFDKKNMFKDGNFRGENLNNGEIKSRNKKKFKFKKNKFKNRKRPKKFSFKKFKKK